MAKSKSSNSEVNYVLISQISGIIVLLLAIFQLGVVGRFLANLNRFFFGDFYSIFDLGLIGLIVYYIIKKQFPKIKKNYIIGGVLIVVPLMVLQTLFLQGQLKSVDITSEVMNIIKTGLSDDNISNGVGGGVIATFIYSFVSGLLTNIGVWVLSFISIFVGVTQIMEKSALAITKNFAGKISGKVQDVNHKVQDRKNNQTNNGTVNGNDQNPWPINQNAVNNNPVNNNPSNNVANNPANNHVANPQINSFDNGNNLGQTSSPVNNNVQPAPAPRPSGSLDSETTDAFNDWFEDLNHEDMKTTTAVPGQDGPRPLTPSSLTPPEVKVDNGFGTDPNKVKDLPAESPENTLQKPKPSFQGVETNADKILNRDKEVEQEAMAQTPAQKAVSDNVPSLAGETDFKKYILPTSSLLEHIPPVDQTQELKSLQEKSEIVQSTLKSFNIDAEVKRVNLGPTVTQYELTPAAGVKVSTITNRADDLALALSAKSIRIEAPIPGKPFVGIEVPNQTQSIVSFENVIASSKFDAKHPLTVPLGRDVTGDVISADLSEMPHLLIAGSTGSGKSVAINGIITSLLMRLKPDEVKLLMVDPKKVELSVYNDIPHLITPVVSEPRKAARALQKAVTEMEERYDLFASNNVRNIEGWNQRVNEYNQTKGQYMPKMPYLVVIVDELADLMMTAKNEVETSIVRIAQMGRAAGVHLILATQRPSVDVITGLIKANVPSRIAFAVSSGIDSRTILDQNGAEKLLGRGDMLFAPIGKEPTRVQGAYIPDHDVMSVTEFIKKQAVAQYDQKMDVENESDDFGGNDGGANTQHDELFEEARVFVIQQKKASSSLLQRHFRIGYGRAARIIDELEEAGVVGPQDGQRPREVLVEA